MDLKQQYDSLQDKFNAMETEFKLLKQFKAEADRTAKQQMIDSFYMLSDDDKADCVANIDTYSLNDIEAKLSILCVRNRVSFDSPTGQSDEAVVATFNLNTTNEDSIPGWMETLRSVAKEII